jgi:hypothetical protein
MTFAGVPLRPLSRHRLVGPPIHYADCGTNILLPPEQRPVFRREAPNADSAPIKKAPAKRVGVGRLTF